MSRKGNCWDNAPMFEMPDKLAKTFSFAMLCYRA